MNMEINPSEYKILIVDDVMSNVLLLKVLLTNEKFAIATASNGRQALEQVEKEFRYGTKTSAALIDAETDLQNAELELQTAIFNQRVSAIELMKSTQNLNLENL